jgi:hypothetical protein
MTQQVEALLQRRAFREALAAASPAEPSWRARQLQLLCCMLLQLQQAPHLQRLAAGTANAAIARSLRLQVCLPGLARLGLGLGALTEPVCVADAACA